MIGVYVRAHDCWKLPFTVQAQEQLVVLEGDRQH